MTLENNLLKYILAIGFVVLIFWFSERNNDYVVLNGDTMGTTYTVKYSQASHNLLKSNIQNNIDTILDTEDYEYFGYGVSTYTEKYFFPSDARTGLASLAFFQSSACSDYEYYLYTGGHITKSKFISDISESIT